MRELRAVILVVQRSLERGWLQEGCDVTIHTDNTNVLYNLRKKRAGWRMRSTVKAFMIWLTEKRIRLDCMHISGVENTKADSLSRLSKSGDYSLRPGVLAKAEKLLGMNAEIDLFAHAGNAQKKRYCTTKHDRDALQLQEVQVRSAFHIRSWNDFGVVLAHPPIPLIPRTIAKIREDKATAILIAPMWAGAEWAATCRQMTIRGPVMLGNCEETLQKGPTMVQKDYSLPPGGLAAWLLQGV
jgi:hypothetical protein